jgi:hypothetical protein
VWIRLLDNEILELARSEVGFRSPSGKYSLIWDPDSQHCPNAVYGGARQT